MNRIRILRLLAVLVLVSGIAALGSCSKKGGGVTNPPPSGNAFDSGTLDAASPTVQGEGFVHVFPNQGTVPYHCNFHSMMHGTVNIATGAADSAFVSIVNNTSSGFSMSSVTIRPGGQVRWKNLDGQPHTATSD